MSLYKRTENYEETILDNEWIILNTENQTIVKLNEIGGFCWSVLDQPKSFESIIQAFHEAYDVQDHPIENDIRQFLADLEEIGLVKHAS